MVMHGGKQEKLFRGAFMQSGAVIPVGDVHQEKASPPIFSYIRQYSLIFSN
jgi:hypothetical protein